MAFYWAVQHLQHCFLYLTQEIIVQSPDLMRAIFFAFLALVTSNQVNAEIIADDEHLIPDMMDRYYFHEWLHRERANVCGEAVRGLRVYAPPHPLPDAGYAIVQIKTDASGRLQMFEILESTGKSFKQAATVMIGMMLGTPCTQNGSLPPNGTSKVRFSFYWDEYGWQVSW